MITTIITIIKIITILIIIIDAAADDDDDDDDDIYSIVTLLSWFPFIIIYMIYHFRIMTQGHCFTWGF